MTRCRLCRARARRLRPVLVGPARVLRLCPACTLGVVTLSLRVWTQGQARELLALLATRGRVTG